MNPIDLRLLFGHEYRVKHDQAASHETGGRRDPWLYVIPCRRGHIYPHSDSQLALWWESSARLDARCPALTLFLDGDDEKVYLFNLSRFEEVASLASARKRRHLQPLQREMAIARLRAFQKT